MSEEEVKKFKENNRMSPEIIEKNGEKYFIKEDEDYKNKKYNKYCNLDRYFIKIPQYGNDFYNESQIDNQTYNKLKINYANKAYTNRLNYEIVFDFDNNKRLIFILFNPSTANEYNLDPTIRNCKRITQALNKAKNGNYGGILIYNTFTVRHPKIDEALEKIDPNYEINNNPIFNICKSINQKDINDICIAWGNSVKKLKKIKINDSNQSYFERINEEIKNLKDNKFSIYAFNFNEKDLKQPTHPSRQNHKQLNVFFDKPELKLITKCPNDPE
ncbi:MAG: DUF1643 domain-containing protein [bacterium]